MEHTPDLTPSETPNNHTETPTTPNFNPLAFHGNSKDFFSIWIVNTLLTIVTLGIYSAWAKVRTNRYLYSNTELNGHRFSYLAQPLQILKGRIIAAIFVGLYFLLSTFSPLAAGVLILVMFALTPALVVLGLRFNMRMTAYRNVRFGFNGSFKRAFIVFSLLPIVGLFTAYLAMPWVLKKMDEYKFGHIAFGQKQFEGELKTTRYYFAVLMSAFISIPVLAAIGYIFVAMMPAEGEAVESGFNLATVMLFLLYIVFVMITSSFYQVVIRNHVFSHMALPDTAKLNSNIRFASLLMLRLTNFLAIVCSLGLAIPWAKIRVMNYFTQHTHVATLAGADAILEQATSETNAVAEEAADMLDIDLSLG